ncbi:hypothetical protein MgSA37_04441 [Mucilaginibacter gotjawali]|uniref:Uncharacterized protein n=1 Tax=Mucilaginibacter gotjawali TaxID=1550579 RepID=A0A0X8XAD7_9SPHI|nr:hypothetical protein MgSA37_04441 [Mucilaginibacter gotjawali]
MWEFDNYLWFLTSSIAEKSIPHLQFSPQLFFANKFLYTSLPT